MRLGSRGSWRVAGVLSVAKLTVGQEAYYEQEVARGLDDYYAGRGESPGIWAGSVARSLGLEGVVTDRDLGTLLRGVDPTSGDQLRAPIRERTITVRRLDRETAEWRDEQKRLAPVSGYDLVFSCPKSVSLLHALTADDRVRREVSEAHESAWQAALAYLERESCVVRRGQRGIERERGEGFVAAAFRHRTSRAQDPHLHTHVVVANMTRAPDGEWRALDGEAIVRTYRLAAGYLYEAHLRNELSARLGLHWTEPEKGMAELEGVPEEAMRAFSTRRESLIEHMEAFGTHGFAAARVAALATREKKEEVDLPRLREDWRVRAAEHGLDHRELRRLLGPPQPARTIELDELAQRLLSHDGLTAKQTTFTTPELVRAIAGALPAGAPVDGILGAADELARFPEIEQLEPELSPGRPARFTTRDLLDIEREALELALNGREADAPRARAEPQPLLSAEQRRLVREAGMSPDRVVCVVGVAGAGKTTALHALADAYTGVPVLGAAPSGRAADELATATGIRSSTLHRLLLDARRDGGLPHRSVLVVDEAGMAETRVLAPLLRLVDDAGGRAILVGDPGQLPAVGAGGLFSALCDRLGALELTQNRRQLDAQERAALARLRAGNPEPYLAHAAASGRLHVGDDATEAKHRLLEDWWRVAATDPARTVMLAYRRHDVRDLNDAARALMLASGLVGAESLTVGGREFRVGDRIVCRRNDTSLSVRNGMRGTVVELDSADRALTLETHAGARRRIPLDYATQHLDHAYALTGHAAQGATVDRAFVLLRDEGALREWGYVACSRARMETRLYLVGDALEPEHDSRPINKGDPTARLAAALERSAAEQPAAMQRPDTSDATRRMRAQRRRACERSLELAERRLATAEQKLSGLGRLGHRRERRELQTQVALERTAVRLARKQLGSISLEPPERHPAPAEGPRIERDRVVRGRVRDLDRGHGLEL